MIYTNNKVGIVLSKPLDNCIILHMVIQIKRDFLILFPPPNVLARRPGNNRHYSDHFSFFLSSFFFPLWRRSTVSSCALMLWLMEPADLSRDLNIFSPCSHLAIMPVSAPWVHLFLKVMRANFLIGYCTLSPMNWWSDCAKLIGVFAVRQEHRRQGTAAFPGTRR